MKELESKISAAGAVAEKPELAMGRWGSARDGFINKTGIGPERTWSV
jgi:hypothetical protein